MKKIFFTRELKFGIIVIGTLFLVYFGLNFLKGINIFSSTYSYYAKYENIGGLVASTPVYVKGYKVGQVDEIQYDFTKEKAFTVKISVSKDIRLPKETIVQLYDDGLMGGRAIQLLIPTTTAQEFYNEDDLITSQSSSGLVDQLSTDLLPKIEVLANQADSLIRSLRNLLDNESLANILGSADKVAADLAVSSSQLKNMMSNQVPQLLNKTDMLVSDFSQIGKNLKEVDFNKTLLTLDHSIASIGDVANKINDDKGTLGALLNDRELYLELLSLSSNADSLILDLKQNPKRYVHFSIFGRKK